MHILYYLSAQLHTLNDFQWKTQSSFCLFHYSINLTKHFFSDVENVTL